MTKTIGFCASFSNSGKTTLLLKVLEECLRRGIKTAVLKHGRHLQSSDMKDSNRFAAAGAAASLIVTPQGWIMEASPKEEMDIHRAAEMLAGCTGADLILVEGYKKAAIRKIAVCRSEISLELPGDECELIAVVSDRELDVAIPQFRFEDIGGLCDFILNIN